MLTQVTRADGSIDPGGFFIFQNEHPVVVAKVLYVLNLKLFGGSNTTLGIIVVLVAIGQLAIIALILARAPLATLQRALLFVLASALLFSPNGAWNS